MTCKTCPTRIRCFLGLKNCPPFSVPSVGSVESSSTAGRAEAQRLDIGRVQAALDEKARQRKLTTDPAPFRGHYLSKPQRVAPGYYQPEVTRERVVHQSVDTTGDILLTAMLLDSLDTHVDPGYTVWEAPAPAQAFEPVYSPPPAPVYEAPAPAPTYYEPPAPSPSYYEAPSPSPSYDSSSYSSDSYSSSSD